MQRRTHEKALMLYGFEAIEMRVSRCLQVSSRWHFRGMRTLLGASSASAKSGESKIWQQVLDARAAVPWFHGLAVLPLSCEAMRNASSSSLAISCRTSISLQPFAEGFIHDAQRTQYIALPVAQRYTGIELDLGLLQGRVIGKAWIACQAGQFIGRMVMRQQTAGGMHPFVIDQRHLCIFHMKGIGGLEHRFLVRRQQTGREHPAALQGLHAFGIAVCQRSWRTMVCGWA